VAREHENPPRCVYIYFIESYYTPYIRRLFTKYLRVMNLKLYPQEEKEVIFRSVADEVKSSATFNISYPTNTIKLFLKHLSVDVNYLHKKLNICFLWVSYG
jgi:hypothetical protein